jgi:hypothetical protein
LSDNVNGLLGAETLPALSIARISNVFEPATP